MSSLFNDFDSSQLIDYLRNLEERIEKIELKLNITSDAESYLPESADFFADREKQSNALELRIGEYWFAQIGIIVLLIGCAILTTFHYPGVNQLLPSIICFSAVGILISTSMFVKSPTGFVSRHIWGSSFILFYLAAFRLFHFSDNPYLSGTLIEAVILFSVVIISYVMSLKKDSLYLRAISFTGAAITSIVLDIPELNLALSIVLAVLFVLEFSKNMKAPFLFLGTILTYVIIANISLGNPLFTGMIEVTGSPALYLITTLIVTFIFSQTYIKPKTDLVNIEIIKALNMASGFLGFMLFQMMNFNKNFEYSFLFQFVFFAVYLGIAFAENYVGKNNISTAFFALIAYLGLSIGIVVHTPLPDVYIYLIWQSLIVIGTAILFKSRNIVAANFAIFLIIFVAYMASADSFGIISVSFGLVALVSARLLNWQKNRLILKTDMMRSVYLAVAFFSLPFTLIKALPIEQVAFGWLVLTLLYYVISAILKNNKYRWMGHLTLISTIIFSFIFALTSSDSTTTVLNFLALGFVLVSVSIFYTKQFKKI